MAIAICPYCKYGVGVIMDECKENLIAKKEGLCTCAKCGKSFIVYYKDKKILTRKQDNNE